MTEDFKVRDEVIYYDNDYKNNELNNKKAVVIAVNNSDCPYLIEFENGYQWWCLKKNVHPIITIKEINWRCKC